MKFTLLTTDVLFFGLIIAAGAYAWYAAGKEHLRAPWREVAKNSFATSAAAVLLTFLIIAILDSVHFYPRLDQVAGDRGKAHYATEVISLFDRVVGRLRSQVEKTYSAPFALTAFSKETIELQDGRSVRDYPRLRYGGAHLSEACERGLDIARRALGGALWAIAIWLCIVLPILYWHARRWTRAWALATRSEINGGGLIPFRVPLAVTAGIAVVVGVCAALAPYYHIFGTDKVGIDVFYQTLKSIRTGLIIGTLTTLVMLPFAIVMGITAGYFRGWIDDVIQYLYTTLSSIPGVLLIAAAALILEVYMVNHADEFTSLVVRADLRLLALCVILGVTSWTGLCRVLRGEAMKLREMDFIEAARAFGVPHTTIILRHMVPNIMHIVMISIVLDFSALVLAEAVLSYINIGVDPTMESWGNMINSARLELAREPVVWWSLLAAFVFMFILVLAANLFADAVRDAFDPRLRVIS
ncbi:MAG: ABC transporter permease [Proteobacteria bacterium]|nr:MAG: ABC transporter permease [Pseudomonadota bacterium]